jgi:hypothetical protein
MSPATRNGMIVARYEAAASYARLAADFDLCPSRVQAIVRRLAPELVRPRGGRAAPHRPARIDDILCSAANGHAVPTIAAAIGVTPRAVRYVLDRYGPRHWRRRAA